MTQKTGDTDAWAARRRRADFCVRNADRLRKQAMRLRERADLDDQAAEKWEAEAMRHSDGLETQDFIGDFERSQIENLRLNDGENA